MVSAFKLKKGSDDRFPWVVSMSGIGATKYQTKAEAMKVLSSARKKERKLKNQFKK